MFYTSSQFASFSDVSAEAEHGYAASPAALADHESYYGSSGATVVSNGGATTVILAANNSAATSAPRAIPVSAGAGSKSLLFQQSAPSGGAMFLTAQSRPRLNSASSNSSSGSSYKTARRTHNSGTASGSR